MFKSIGLLILISLSGCALHGQSFDCPVSKDGIQCQSISHVSKSLYSNLITIKQHPRPKGRYILKESGYLEWVKDAE